MGRCSLEPAGVASSLFFVPPSSLGDLSPITVQPVSWGSGSEKTRAPPRALGHNIRGNGLSAQFLGARPHVFYKFQLQWSKARACLARRSQALGPNGRLQWSTSLFIILKRRALSSIHSAGRQKARERRAPPLRRSPETPGHHQKVGPTGS